MLEKLDTLFNSILNTFVSVAPPVLWILAILDVENAPRLLLWSLVTMYLPEWRRRFEGL